MLRFVARIHTLTQFLEIIFEGFTHFTILKLTLKEKPFLVRILILAFIPTKSNIHTLSSVTFHFVIEK